MRKHNFPICKKLGLRCVPIIKCEFGPHMRIVALMVDLGKDQGARTLKSSWTVKIVAWRVSTLIGSRTLKPGRLDRLAVLKDVILQHLVHSHRLENWTQGRYDFKWLQGLNFICKWCCDYQSMQQSVRHYPVTTRSSKLTRIHYWVRLSNTMQSGCVEVTKRLCR